MMPSPALLVSLAALVSSASGMQLRAPQRVLSGSLGGLGAPAGALGGVCLADTTAPNSPKTTCDGSLVCVASVCANDPCHVSWPATLAGVILHRGGGLAAPHSASADLKAALLKLLPTAPAHKGAGFRVHTVDYPTICSVTDGGGA